MGISPSRASGTRHARRAGAGATAGRGTSSGLTSMEISSKALKERVRTVRKSGLPTTAVAELLVLRVGQGGSLALPRETTRLSVGISIAT